MNPVTQVMNDQQRSMLWALLTVRRMTRKALRSAVSPDFPQLKKLTGYVERYSEGLHQQNEERLLFVPVEARQPALARTVKRLRRDHAAMKGYGIRLRGFLTYWEQGDPNAGAQAALVADDYATFCLRHVRAEQEELMPVALKVLSDAEQAQAAQAFASAADPLASATSGQGRATALSKLN